MSSKNYSSPLPPPRALLPALRVMAVRGLFPLGDRLFGQHISERLEFLRQAQWWSPEKITAARNQSLSELMRVASAEVPFYRELLESRRLTWRDFTRPEDLGKLPVLGKAELRPAYPDRLTRPTGQRTYEARSSGSTGANFAVREDAETAGQYRASFMLSLEWAGWRMGEPHLQLGMTPRQTLDRRLKDLFFGCHYESAQQLSDRNLDRILGVMEAKKLRNVWGYPVSVYLLARRAALLGWNQPMRSVVTWGDMLVTRYRRHIEEAFQVNVTDTYGCGEGFQIAAQCKEGRYHLHALDCVVELLDEAGQPVGPGEEGRVVVTRLHPGPMPLIRYNVGDVASRSTGGACACGRGFELLDSIHGRTADMVVTPSGNRLIVHFFTGTLEHIREIVMFQVVQRTAGDLLVRVVARPFDQALASRIIQALVEAGLNDMHIEVEPVDTIPVSAAGKRKFILSELASETANGAAAATVTRQTTL